MCIIVDNNVVTRVLLTDADPDFAPVNKGLFTSVTQPLTLVHGGLLTEEYAGSSAVVRALYRLRQAGRVTIVPDDAVESEMKKVSREGNCVSNDLHVVALARLSRARVLVSLDRDLGTDFTHAKIVAQPRGKVYKTNSKGHLALLKFASQCCPVV